MKPPAEKDVTRNITFAEWEAEQLRDPEFRKASEALEPWFQAEQLRIRKRVQRGEP